MYENYDLPRNKTNKNNATQELHVPGNKLLKAVSFKALLYKSLMHVSRLSNGHKQYILYTRNRVDSHHAPYSEQEQNTSMELNIIGIYRVNHEMFFQKQEMFTHRPNDALKDGK